MISDKESGGHRITRAAGAISSGVLVSRLLGFIRDMIIAKLFPAFPVFLCLAMLALLEAGWRRDCSGSTTSTRCWRTFGRA